MPRERSSGFFKLYNWIMDGGQEREEAMQVTGYSRESVNRHIRELENRKTVFEQVPEFGEQGEFLGWKTIDNGKINLDTDL